jgi:hypothetical protein
MNGLLHVSKALEQPTISSRYPCQRMDDMTGIILTAAPYLSRQYWTLMKGQSTCGPPGTRRTGHDTVEYQQEIPKLRDETDPPPPIPAIVLAAISVPIVGAIPHNNVPIANNANANSCVKSIARLDSCISHSPLRSCDPEYQTASLPKLQRT